MVVLSIIVGQLYDLVIEPVIVIWLCYCWLLVLVFGWRLIIIVDTVDVDQYCDPVIGTVGGTDNCYCWPDIIVLLLW